MQEVQDFRVQEVELLNSDLAEVEPLYSDLAMGIQPEPCCFLRNFETGDIKSASSMAADNARKRNTNDFGNGNVVLKIRENENTFAHKGVYIDVIFCNRRRQRLGFLVHRSLL